MLSRALSDRESVCRCRCGHVVVAVAGDKCPRCRRTLPDVRVIAGALVMAVSLHGPEHLARLAPEFGVVGRLVVDGGRVLGVVDGGRR